MKRKTSALLPTLALAFGFVGGNEGEGKSAALENNVAIQLSERLGTARIKSPLVGLAAAHAIDSLSDPEMDTLVEEDFEDFDWEFTGWPETSAASIVTEGEGHVLRLEGRSEAALGWILPVQPDAFYSFERSVRVLGVPFCDFYVVESRREVDETRPDPRTYFLAGRGEALKIHSLPIESGVGTGETWQRASTSFYPTPRTRSLALLIRPRTGADPETTVRSMYFDDVRLEEVLPSRKERIQLLKGAHLAKAADAALGMRKAGRLLPLPSPEGVQEGESAESNYDWRQALYAPPTTELAFDLDLPEGARLRFATGLARETPPNAAARFQVELFQPGMSEPELLLDLVRVARMEEWSWEDVDLDLSPWAGRKGTLLLRTLAEEGDPHPLWGNPRIEPGAGASDPLVILIAVDTLRADRLSSYGYERPTTPALDRLAAEGVRFDQARSNCNWTCPSFASIFTGLVPARHGVSSYGPATPLPDELVTLAEYFQSSGWATRSIAYKVPLFDGNYEQGFDQAFNVPRDVIRGEENLARALEWLEAYRGGPSFLFLHFNDPHQPFVHPEPLDRSFDPETPSSDDSSETEEEQTAFANQYDGAVAYVDSCIGRFLDTLRERGLYERATIAFVADHGEQLWEHGRFGHGGADLYDEIVRVPLIVKPPAGTFEPGQVIEADVSGFDVMPTLLELAGIQPTEDLDARSLVPIIQGVESGLDRVVVTEAARTGFALVNGGYKFVLRPGGGEELLFNLRSDPHELHDIASEQPEELARLRSLAIAYVLEHRPGNYLLVHTDQEDVRLRALTRSLRAWVGPDPKVDRSSDPPQSTVDLAANAWALFEVEGPDAANALVRGLEVRGPATGFEPWTTGRLASLREAGIWRVQGPQPRRPLEQDAEPIDPELLEALKRLGYAE